MPKPKRPKSSCIAVVEPERAAKAFATLNGSRAVLVASRRHDELVLQALVMTLPVVVLDVLADDPPQLPLSERNEPTQAPIPYGSHESFGTPAMLPVSLRSTEHGARIQIGTSRGKFNVFMPVDARISVKCFVNTGSRSWINYRMSLSNPSTGSVRFLATCSVHLPYTW